MTKEYLVNIVKGKHAINPSMNIDILRDLKIYANSHYLIQGENGTGKSSFIRNVLFKAVKNQCQGKIQYLYFDQEIMSQFYYGKAYFAMNKNLALHDIPDFIYALTELHLATRLYDNNNFILILDETDKFVETQKLLKLFKERDLSLISVSHNIIRDISYHYELNITKHDEHNSTIKIQ